MKKLMMFGCMLAAMAGFTACEDDTTGNDGYEGINYIYLSTQEGKTTIYETDSDSLVVEVMLTAALKEDLALTFAVTGTEGVVSIEGNPVTIKAGEKTGSFKIVSNNANVLEASANFTVGLAADVTLPENVELKVTLSFVVTPVIVEEEEPTDEKTALLNAYKEATGIDLSKYIGLVDVSTVIIGTDPDSGEPLDPKTVTGKTLIELSESATAEAPVLKMSTNPMGIEDHMYQILRSVTVDYEDWYSEWAGESYATLMEAINWNATSEEVFSMSLDGITFNSDQSIDFLGTYVDEYDEECIRVPFDYSFTAFEREKAAIEAGIINPAEDDEWAWDATADPNVHLNNSDISEDWFECGNWIEATAEISENELKFTFCVYGCWLDSDFTRIVATYTPNN